MKKARKPWTPEAKVRHKAGVKAYQEWRRMCELMDLLLQLSDFVKADPVDLGTTALAERDVMGHATFEEYCKERWDMGRNYADKLIASSKAIDNVGTIVPMKPVKDRFKQIAEILPAEERFKRLRELTVDTMQKIKSGVIPHPLVQG